MDKSKKIKKLRRITAIIGLIIIVLLYIYVFLLAIRNDPRLMNAVFGAFAATIIVPVIMYALGLLAKSIEKYSNTDKSDDTKKDF